MESPPTDLDILNALSEFAKIDNKAFNILVEIQEACKWEDIDIAYCKAENYLKENV